MEREEIIKKSIERYNEGKKTFYYSFETSEGWIKFYIRRKSLEKQPTWEDFLFSLEYLLIKDEKEIKIRIWDFMSTSGKWKIRYFNHGVLRNIFKMEISDSEAKKILVKIHEKTKEAIESSRCAYFSILSNLLRGEEK